jgi:ABC-2 type transport system permease protein
METALDLSRWREAPRGVGYRRWVIISAGIRQLLAGRLFKGFVYVAWFGGLLIAVLAFVFSQSIAEGGWLETLASKAGPREEALVKAIGALVTLYPDICVSGAFTLIFWLHSFLGLGLCLLALTTMVPQLITRDRASNALTIYLSRPLTSGDYLLGKFGTICGVMLLLWAGPIVFGWGLSMVLSSDRDFIIYSIMPLLRALAFSGIALVVLAPIALGVSAVHRSSRVTVVVWMALWLGARVFAEFPDSPAVIRHASFTHNLKEVRQKVLRLDEALALASKELPIMSERFTQNLARSAQKAEAEHPKGAVIGLGVLVLISSAVCFRRLKAE